MSFTCLIYHHVNIVVSQINETQYYPFKVVCFHISYFRQLLVRQYKVYYPVRNYLIQHMITAMQKLGFTSNVSISTWYNMMYDMVWCRTVWWATM